MKKFYKFILLLLCFSLRQSASAQIDTNIFKSKIITYTITEKQIDRNEKWLPLDTSITKNELFHPMYSKYGLFQDMGNIGSAGQSLIFDYNKSLGYKFTQNPWSAYFYKPEERVYYNSKQPITDINFTQGGVDMIYLKTKLAINITPRWMFGVDYFRLTSKGNFVRQKNSEYFTQAFTYYQSKTGKYALLANLTWNLGYNEESGGLSKDSSFESLSGGRKTGNVNLNTTENGFRNRSFYMKQYFYYGKSTTQFNKDDTTENFISYGHFSHTLKAEDEVYYLRVTNDSNLNIFPNGLIKAFNDSVTSQTFTNKFAYTLYNTDRKNEMRFVEFAATHQFLNTDLQTNKRTYNNVVFEGTIEREVYKNYGFSFKAHGAYSPLGYNQNDIKLSGDIGYKTPWFNLSGGIFNHLYTPDFTFTYFNSTQFNWDNSNFNKINISNIHGSLQTRVFKHNFKFTFNQNILANWVYFGKEATPIQNNDIALVNTIEVQKTFQLWKFYFDNRIIYQKASENYIRLPEVGAILRYYFQQMMFQKALNLQLGVDVFYNTDFYAQAYNPATRGFYLQDKKLIGNYPLINVFVCGEIRHAVIFASYEHLNQDWVASKGFYSTPGNPLALTTFRLGIRWRMYN